jgi:non-specific serine/threonine protein kinase
MTSFVGRREALVGVGERLGASRVVSIVGPGGVGKSRLAVEAADCLSHRYRDGVWIAELHSALSEAGIYGSIASVFDLAEVPGTMRRDLVASFLRDLEMLLILDNCEHLADQVAGVVHDLAESCPRLRLLATSRERMRMSWEMVWVLEGLEVPMARVDPGEELPESVELFRQRALAVDPRFEINDGTADSVGDVCRQLDGLPLAIELAAAHLNAFSPADISVRMDDMARFLKSPHRDVEERHSSLHTVMSWSYGLLSTIEQRTLARLGVFSGGFDYEMAKAVTGYGKHHEEFDEVLESLIDKSLVVRMGDPGDVRYRLLESLRQFAMGILTSQQQLAEARDRHAAEFTALALEAEPELWSRDQARWLARLEAEHDNFRAALRWLIDQGAASEAQRLAGCLARFWDLRGHYTEGLQWLQRVTAMGMVEDPLTTVLVSNGLATLALLNGDVVGSMEACHAAIDGAERCGDLPGKAYALQYLGLCSIYAEDLDEARRTLDESVLAAEAAGLPLLSGWSGVFLTAVELSAGDLEAGRIAFTEARRLLEEAEEAEGIAWTYVAEGIERWMSGDAQLAARALQSAMTHLTALRAGWGVSVAAVLAGRILLDMGENTEAATILAQSETLRTSLGAVHLPIIARLLDEGLEKAGQLLGASDLASISQASADVAADRVEQIVVSVVEDVVARIGPPSRQGGPAPRTEDVAFVREGDVWALTFRERTMRLRHVIGFEHLAVLLNTPGREWAAVELAGWSRARTSISPDLPTGGMSEHELLDVKAITELRQRLIELEDEIEESERWSDFERAAHRREEMEAITARLAVDLGLNGRPREFAANAERARVNVTKAIRSAIARIAEVFRDLGEHLSASITTGTFCGYRPDPSSTIRWKVFSSRPVRVGRSDHRPEDRKALFDHLGSAGE